MNNQQDHVLTSLINIVGDKYVSNNEEELYLYSYDSGVSEPRKPEYVVMPKNTDQVSKIVKIANKFKKPVVPVGAMLILSGLTIPQRGGIVLDLKRMDIIHEVNEKSRYAVVDPGVSQGQLMSYLEKNYPSLRHSAPDAPPMATVVANALIYGSGRLSEAYGFHSDMINGMEVVLPSGEICTIGSGSVSPFWFSKMPLPDLTGLFIGWFGTTGIVTKLSLKLYPNKKIRDVEVFSIKNPACISELIYKVTETEIAEEIKIFSETGFKEIQFVFWITGNTKEEIKYKKNIIKTTLKDNIYNEDGKFLKLSSELKQSMLEIPEKSATLFADTLKGGGFEYVGAVLMIDQFEEAYMVMLEIAKKYNTIYSLMARIVDRGRCMIFTYNYAFNRADPQNIERTRKQLNETNKEVLKLGGIPWKAEIPAQKMIMEKMDNNTLKLMNKIKEVIDPHNIMNPGNWEV